MQQISLLLLRRRDQMQPNQYNNDSMETHMEPSSSSSAPGAGRLPRARRGVAKKQPGQVKPTSKGKSEHEQDNTLPHPSYHTLPSRQSSHNRLTRTSQHVSQRPGSTQRRLVQARLHKVYYNYSPSKTRASNDHTDSSIVNLLDGSLHLCLLALGEVQKLLGVLK